MKILDNGVRVHFGLCNMLFQLFLQAWRMKTPDYLSHQVVTKKTKYEKVLCS